MARARILALTLVASLPAAFAVSPEARCETELCRLVLSGSLSDLRLSDFSAYRTRVQSFYEPGGYAPAWVRDGSVTNQAKAILEVLQGAAAKGLNPEDYDGSRWPNRLEQFQRRESDAARFDLALTISLMRYISDLHFGRANPNVFHVSKRPGNSELDIPAFVRQRLTYGADVKAALVEIEPPYDGYRRTERALQQYAAMAREYQTVPFPVARKPVEPGSSYEHSAQLAMLLKKLGDLPPDAGIDIASKVYSASLVSAVKRFQLRHGLDPDGRLGKATITQLNIPLSQRVLQLQLALERWRWVPHTLPQPPIVINIPEFVLRAVNDSYRTELEMKVIVWKAYRHQTPVFAAAMNQVVFRPYWNVPLSIQRAELVPKIERDPSYLSKNQFEVVTPQNKVVTDGIMDRTILGQLRSGKLHIRQLPGPENALGLVAFMFPNEHDVYLHGTPAMELFSRARRDFSHGCIRAEKPQQLAAWILRNQSEWTPEAIAGAMNGDKTIRVSLDRPIPVLIVYSTAVVLAGGEVRFFDDIYDQDSELAKLLAQGYANQPR